MCVLPKGPVNLLIEVSIPVVDEVNILVCMVLAPPAVIVALVLPVNKQTNKQVLYFSIFEITRMQQVSAPVGVAVQIWRVNLELGKYSPVYVPCSYDTTVVGVADTMQTTKPFVQKSANYSSSKAGAWWKDYSCSYLSFSSATILSTLASGTLPAPP